MLTNEEKKILQEKIAQILLDKLNNNSIEHTKAQEIAQKTLEILATNDDQNLQAVTMELKRTLPELNELIL